MLALALGVQLSEATRNRWIGTRAAIGEELVDDAAAEMQASIGHILGSLRSGKAQSTSRQTNS